MAEQEIKVLLIEDNPGDAFLTKFYLGESVAPAFHVSHAETIKDALDFLRANKFDLILSDMNLPDSFGMDTVKSILGNFPGNLVIVLTGLNDADVGLESVRYGAQDFLVKGKFDGKILISSVLFAYERFKLNNDNSRFNNIQRLLNVGFFELENKTNSFFISDSALKLLESNSEKIETFEKFLALIDDAEQLKRIISDTFEKGGKGEFSFARKNKKYLLAYEADEKKFMGVIRQ